MKKLLSLVVVLCLILTATIAFDVSATGGVINSNSPGFSRVMFISVLRELNNGRNTFTMAQARRLTRLTVRDTHNDSVSRGLTGIELLPNLRTVVIETHIMPNHFRRLEQLPRLRILRFSGQALFGPDLSPISGLRNLTSRLRRLEIRGTNPETHVTLESLNGIQNFRNLERLEVPNNRLANLRGIERLTNLRILNVSDNRITNLNRLRHTRRLAHINASTNAISCADGIRNLPNLRRINLSNNNLRRIPNLTGRRTLTANSPTSFGNDFRYNQLSRTQFNTKLPARIRRVQSGRWLQRQIASQNLD